MQNKPTAYSVMGEPAPQGSKMLQTRGGKTWLREASKKVEPWREAVAAQVAARMAQTGANMIPKGEAVALELTFYLPRTKAMGDKPAPPMVQRPDLDKLARSTLDGLTGVLFEDDSQVVRLNLKKERAEYLRPTGCYIEIW